MVLEMGLDFYIWIPEQQEVRPSLAKSVNPRFNERFRLRRGGERRRRKLHHLHGYKEPRSLTRARGTRLGSDSNHSSPGTTWGAPVAERGCRDSIQAP